MRLRTVCLAAVATLITGCGSILPVPKSSPSATLDISGTIAVRGGVSQNGLDGEPCTTTGAGFKDIQEGVQVVVTDAASKTIALAALGPGKMRRPGGPDALDRHCVFPFAVSAPAGHDFYGVEVSHRGRVQFTAAQVKTPLELTLGD
ncbi:hypothetical protein ACFYUV_20355 [Nonomuraea sp. NPDC003560]|uniref:hypothetical protein n=1 Tax=Nonomuraea sp. NPDC003560 TaxID=3364341 RepID=UPI0036AC7563